MARMFLDVCAFGGNGRFPPHLFSLHKQDALTKLQEPPRVDPERFLSMIRFDTRPKLDDLPDFLFDS